MKRVLSILLASLCSVLALAQTADEILRKVEEHGFFGTGRGSFYAAFGVEIQEKDQPKVDYAFRLWGKQYPDGVRKFLLVWTAPEEVAGTLFLAHVSPERKTKMWLYLPELKILMEFVGEAKRRVEFIKGSGITYEDLSRGFGYREDYKGEVLGQEVLNSYPTWKLSLTPKVRGAEWARIVLWVHQELYFVVRVKLYGAKADLVRIISVPELVTDKLGLRPALLRIENLAEGSWAEVRIFERSGVEIPEEYFSPENLPRLAF